MFQSLLENNLANSDRINYLRKLGTKAVAYLTRGRAKKTGAIFREVEIQLLAPEPDVSVYYKGGGRERALTTASPPVREPRKGIRNRRDPDHGFVWDFPSVARAGESNLGGVSRSDFERLRRSFREGGITAARFIDRAQNNTSLCLFIEADGERLLLPGDAEIQSWDVMKRKCGSELRPVDFLKVSHRGSHNGTPLELLDSLLPINRKAQAQVLVSTKRNVYGTQHPVPDNLLLKKLERRCRKLVATNGETGTSVHFFI
jgi:hypothetical protein